MLSQQVQPETVRTPTTPHMSTCSLVVYCFLPIYWEQNGMSLIASNVKHRGNFFVILLSCVSTRLFSPYTQFPAPLSLQILQVAIQIFISFSLLLINKRRLQSKTMLIHLMLICPLILFIISLLSHCSWPLLFP